MDKKEFSEKYKIQLQEYSREQLKLSKTLKIKDTIKLDEIEKIGAIETLFAKNKIIVAIIVCNNNFEILDQEYFSNYVAFPYISGYRAYRELPSIIQAYNKLEEKPEIILIKGNGILHPRGLGLASHLSLAISIPTIGITSDLSIGEIEGENILLNNKIVGKTLKTKEGANPIYISPGNLISLESSLKLIKKLIKEPHKLPEPLRLARKYAKEVMEELSV